MDLGQCLIVLFTGVVAVSTVVYAFLTWKLVSETRTMRKAQTEPRVSVRVELDHDGRRGFELVVRNEGHGPAKKIRVKFDGGRNVFGESRLSNPGPEIEQLSVFKDGIAYMEPGETLRYFLGMTTREAFECATKTPWTFCAEYQNLAGDSKNDVYKVDFSQFKGVLFDRNYLEQMNRHLESIQIDIHRLTAGVTHLHVDTHRKRSFWTNVKNTIKKICQ